MFTIPLDAFIPAPSSLVGAGSNADDYVDRFASEDLRGPIASDNARDDETLKSFVKTVHLDDIWSTVKDLAVQEAEADVAQEIDKQQRYTDFIASWDEDAPDEDDFGVDEEEEYIKEEELDDDNVVRAIEAIPEEGEEDVDMED